MTLTFRDDSMIIPMILGILSLAIGVILAMMALYMIRGHMEVLSWPEVSAEILEVGLYHTPHDKDSSLAYSVRVRYAYSYGGRRYSGTQVSFDVGSDNVGTYHHRIYNELRHFRDSGLPFRCYVNPSDPSEAVLYRDLRREKVRGLLVTALIFGVPGLLLVVLWMRRRKKRKREKLMHRYPVPLPSVTEPHRGRIITSCFGRDAARGALGFGLFCLLLFYFFCFLFLIPKAAELEDSFGRVIVYGFSGIPLIFALVFLYLGFRLSLRLSKYGDSVFEMTSDSGVIGGELSGRIRVRTVPPGSSPHLTFRCVRKRRMKSLSGEERTECGTLWEKSLVIRQEELPDRHTEGTEIPVLFPIPGHLPESDDSDPKDSICWELTAEAGSGWLKYEAEFTVPVFRILEGTPLPDEEI
ncbi:MAG: hypothetical protein DRI57_33015 [Deltaproteobacteria bacterium]|nr:MAG: hypothetical protein DRI57_33015 [Deltaproteobacteria bacterium]